VSFVLYPAIDVRGGAVVRLRQGDYARETRYPVDPLQLACRYAEEGAQWLHLVDLDAARSGGYGLGALIAAIKATTTLRVQTGGGVRNAQDAAAILDAGADRVVVGSLAVREPHLACEWLDRFGAERLTMALDMRPGEDGRWRLPSHGWTSDSDAEPGALLDLFARNGLRHLLCTDIARDGMLAGPNIALYRWIRARAPSLRVQASGGIRDGADLLAARAAGCAGAIVGKSLLEGACSLGETLDEVARC